MLQYFCFLYEQMKNNAPENYFDAVVVVIVYMPYHPWWHNDKAAISADTTCVDQTGYMRCRNLKAYSKATLQSNSHYQKCSANYKQCHVKLTVQVDCGIYQRVALSLPWAK